MQSSKEGRKVLVENKNDRIQTHYTRRGRKVGCTIMQQTADIRRLEWRYWELNQPKRGRGGAEGLNDFWLGEEHMMCNESTQRFQSNRKARERKRWGGIVRHEIRWARLWMSTGAGCWHISHGTRTNGIIIFVPFNSLS